MLFALLLGLLPIASGAVVTYLYDEDAPLAARLCAGACTGFAALGLVGFVIASFLGLTPPTLVLTAALSASPLALLLKGGLRARAYSDVREAARYVRHAILHPSTGATALLVFYLLVALLLWAVFARAMFERADGIFTGIDNNLGDLPFHISIITSFARGENFPPEHPEFAGVRLTYPFIVDFVAAMFVRAGAGLQGAMFWQNFVLALALVGLLHRWALKLTRDPLAAALSPVLVLLSGGLGWWMLLREAREDGRGLLALLTRLPHDYTITTDLSFRWGNTLTTLFVPQRGILLGLPVALVVWTLWWQVVGGADAATGRSGDTETRGRVDEKKQGRAHKKGARQQKVKGASLAATPHPAVAASSSAMRRMIAAGVVAGLLPLVHAHSFVVMMAMGGCLALLFPRWWRAWGAFFAVALLVAAPQMFWATRDSAVRAGDFFGWHFGWDRGKQDVVWFWFKNTGLFIPLLIAALLWRGRAPLVPQRLLLFYLPFTLCFIIPNLGKLSPWIWDNIKVILYWYVASVPLVALLLARLWRGGGATRAGAAALLLVLTLAGSLDVWRVVSKTSMQRTFDRDGIAFAEMIDRVAAPRSLILHAPTYNHPVFLTGRRSPMGYAGHLWTHGLDYAPREADLRRMYAGAPGAEALLARYGIDYVVISPLERAAVPVNEPFFERYTKVGEVGAYRLYKTARP